ncbi:DUF6139 family protein [Massilia sp. TS11]|uniref:DUF6139 family protein n=1 Tax=Massilia sp. TS11 TaxID=2908003 RepID=UPI001EDB6169|nr:DUF6139 family protein [Massilia sp. TS11]MCG2586714.1 DUF6139 family protein [Massilia sp. TS11]
MRLDIYQRPGTPGHPSYLAVPAERPIPEEATNTDWQCAARGLDIDDEADQLPDYEIGQLRRQLAEKGYAITALNGH